MKYRAGERRKAIEYERAIAEWWKKHKIFERSVEERPLDKSYVFHYQGKEALKIFSQRK